MESYGWTSTQLNMWSETSVFLPVGIFTLLWAIFIMPRMLPDQPERPITAVAGRKLQEKEPLTPVREFLGYGIFVAVIIGLMMGFSSWQVTLAGAIIVVASGVLTEREAIDNMNMSTVLLYVASPPSVPLWLKPAPPRPSVRPLPRLWTASPTATSWASCSTWSAS